MFLGWVLDQVVEDDIDQALPADLVVYQKVMAGMAASLNELDSERLQPQLVKLASQYHVNLLLDKTSNLALPESLEQQLNANNALVLQSDEATHFYHLLKAHPSDILSMSIPKDIEEGYVRDVAFTLILYLGIGLSLIIWLVPLTKRLSLLDKLAARFGQGELDVRIQPSRFSYIDGIESSFNRMATQIETLVADNKLLAGSLSHDLRTPVACLRFGIEAAIDCDHVQQKATYLQRVEQELTQLEDMLEAFLEYASMERHALSLNPALHDLAQLVTSIANELKPLATHNKQSITLHNSFKHTSFKHNSSKHNFSNEEELEPISVYFDGHWLNRAVLNLVSNAMDYCHSKIVIELQEREFDWQINVHDDGKGVAEDKQESIFDAFVTANTSRTRQNTNFGLGLAIVKRVANWHGGQVKVDTSLLLGGACFCLTLPKVSPLISKGISPK